MDFLPLPEESPMAKDSELYDWLQSQTDGGRVESEGTFTLSQDEAWSKLSAFQLSIEEGWVLKLVQAVNGLSGAKLTVDRTTRQTHFQVLGPEVWFRSELEERIFCLDVTSTQALDCLAAAVRILVQMKNRPFLITYCDGERVGWTGDRFGDLPAQPAGPFSLTVGHYALKGTPGARSADGARAYANIAGALRQHCHLSPAPIRLDLQWLLPGVNDLDMGTPARGRVLGLLPVPPDKTPADLTPLELTQIKNTGAELGAVVIHLNQGPAWTLGDCKVAVLVSVFAESPGRLLRRASRLLWVNQGVVVHRESLELPGSPVALAILVSSEGLPTDLTGMVPRDSEEYRARRAAALLAAPLALRSTPSERLLRIEPRRLPLVAAGAGVSMGFLLDPTLGSIVIGICAASLLRRRRMAREQQGVEHELEGLLQLLTRPGGEV